MTDVTAYLAEIELALVSSPILREYDIVRSWAHTEDGYLRLRGVLINGDFIEAAEYFAVQGDHVATVDYRHQWMSGDQTELLGRWDSTPDHPELTGFPYHVHVGAEKTVQPDRPRSLLEILHMLEDAVLRPGQ